MHHLVQAAPRLLSLIIRYPKKVDDFNPDPTDTPDPPEGPEPPVDGASRPKWGFKCSVPRPDSM